MVLKPVDETQQKVDESKSSPLKTPSKTDGTPDKGKTYSQEEADKYANDKNAATGRELKTAKDAIQSLADQITNLTDANKESKQKLDALEVEKIKGDPAQMSAYQAKKAAIEQSDTLAAREADVNKREADVKEKLATISKTERANILDNYTKLGVNPALMQNLDTLSNEQLETVCKNLTAGKQIIQPLIKVDSGKTIGGKNTQDLTPEQKIAQGLEDRKNS